MPHSNPLPPKEFQILSHLHSRMTFSPVEKRNFEYLTKGLIGEQKFFNLLKQKLSTNHVLLFSLLLNHNNTEFQIDSLLIDHHRVYILEVKNYEGDFYIENEKWYIKSSRKEIRNPLLQLQRTEFLFKQLLQKLGFNFRVKSYIIFINDSFTLYQAPKNLPAVFPTQLSRFIKKLNSIPFQPARKHTKLTKQLTAIHLEHSSNSRLPKYDYDQLKKGITCVFCYGFLSFLNDKRLICENCNRGVEIDSAVMRNVVAFKILFPERKITTGAIHEWCKIIDSKKTIRRILLKHLKLIGRGRASHYVFPN